MRGRGVALLALVAVVAGCAVTPHHTATSPTEGCISRQEDALLSPGHPAHLEVEEIESGVVLRWPGTGSDVIRYYEVYHRLDAASDWVRIGEIPATRDNTGEYVFRVLSPTPAAQYGVAAVDVYGNRSAITIGEGK